MDFFLKVFVMIVVSDEKFEKVIDIILECCLIGNSGDGKIFVLEVSEVIRISSKERNVKL